MKAPAHICLKIYHIFSSIAGWGSCMRFHSCLVDTQYISDGNSWKFVVSHNPRKYRPISIIQWGIIAEGCWIPLPFCFQGISNSDLLVLLISVTLQLGLSADGTRVLRHLFGLWLFSRCLILVNSQKVTDTDTSIHMHAAHILKPSWKPNVLVWIWLTPGKTVCQSSLKTKDSQ